MLGLTAVGPVSRGSPAAPGSGRGGGVRLPAGRREGPRRHRRKPAARPGSPRPPPAAGGRQQPRRRPGRWLAPAHRPPPAERSAHLGQSLSAPCRPERQAAARRSQRRRRPRRGLPGQSRPRKRQYQYRRQHAPAYGPAQEQLRPARLRGATRSWPGAADPRTPGGCRPGACSACHRDHPSVRRAAARRTGFGAWLTGPARGTGTPPGYASLRTDAAVHRGRRRTGS